jgi:pimeloyl-ACP methyl ester carboxylesterase
VPGVFDINSQTHYLKRRIPYDDVALTSLLSVEPSQKVIVFVHGYGGNPISTWADFDRLSILRPEFRGHDLIFYEYDGLEAELKASANLFYNFLAWLFKSPVAAINNCLPKEAQRPASFGYDEIVLVCHSLGAVIARLALLRATQENQNWPSRIKLVLFAPAHKGARVLELALEVLTHFRFIALFSGMVRFKSPLIDQLKKDSRELIDLENGTTFELQNGANRHLIARTVCIAEKEHIVFNDRFCQDPEGDPIRHSTHKTVCKPRQEVSGRPFLKPLQALIDSL